MTLERNLSWWHSATLENCVGIKKLRHWFCIASAPGVQFRVERDDLRVWVFRDNVRIIDEPLMHCRGCLRTLDEVAIVQGVSAAMHWPS